jgi:hypothetical protein
VNAEHHRTEDQERKINRENGIDRKATRRQSETQANRKSDPPSEPLHKERGWNGAEHRAHELARHWQCRETFILGNQKARQGGNCRDQGRSALRQRLANGQQDNISSCAVRHDGPACRRKIGVAPVFPVELNGRYSPFNMVGSTPRHKFK